MSRIRTILFGLAVVANACIITLLSFWLMSLPWLAGDEKFLIWSSSAVKLLFQKIPNTERFALINTSDDLQLIDKFDEFGFPVGNQVITDRSKLADLMNIINSNSEQPNLVFLDIFFETSTEQDSILEASIAAFPNHLVSYHLTEEGLPATPALDSVNIGLSDYVVGNIFDGVYKYQLIHKDSLKLSPLVAFELLQRVSAYSYGPFVKIGDRLMLNNFIVNYRVLQRDIDYQNGGFNPINLGELLFLPADEITSYLRNKIVVIGDFRNNDFHETLFELTSGPLILVNILLSLEAGDTDLSVLFFMILIAGFVYLSYMTLSDHDVIEQFIKKKFRSAIFLKYLAGFTSYLMLLTLLSLLLFFLFNVHLNVFFLACYCYALDRASSYISQKFG